MGLLNERQKIAHTGLSYSENILDHFKHPRSVGILDEGDCNVGTGMVGNPQHGNVIKLQIKVNERGNIEEVKFKAYGSVAVIAASSLITEHLQGKTLEEAQLLDHRCIVEKLDIVPLQIHCAVLAEQAIEAAIADYLNKRSKKSS